MADDEHLQEELLCEAARSGDSASVLRLIAAGADVSHFDHNGMTPLMHAASHGHADDVAALLAAGAPWNALTPTGLSAGDFAMERSHQAAFDLLLNAALQAELVLGTLSRANHRDEGYLEERILFSEDKILDGGSKAVMMEWERPLMEAHARAICSAGVRDVLNVGFGMGLVDVAIQRYAPARHTIVEAHPEVYRRMVESGWGEKENVRIVFGRWQDVIPQLESYDADWWSQFGDECPELQKFAIRVLSLTCSASGCERNWSSFNQIHTKRRNRLTQAKLNDLVYVMFNLKLKQREIRRKTMEDPLCLDDVDSSDEWVSELQSCDFEAYQELDANTPIEDEVVEAEDEADQQDNSRRKRRKDKGIFFDTYGEYYEDLREFHQHLPKLLKPGGIYSYFNGLCGDNAFFHVVYCQLVALELGNLGTQHSLFLCLLRIAWAEEVWKGVKQKYWQLDTYYLPVCQVESDS